MSKSMDSWFTRRLVALGRDPAFADFMRLCGRVWPRLFLRIVKAYRTREFLLPGIDFERGTASIGEATFVKRTREWHLRRSA